MSLQLHYDPGTAAMIPHIVLEELGVPYERVLVDRSQNRHKEPDFLRLNPNGLLPVLTDGELVLYETAAIVLHLCDTHPQARLAPELGTAARAHFYKWLMWCTNTLQATLLIYFYPQRWVQESDAGAASQVQQKAQEKIAGMLDQLDALLASHGGPWILGGDYGALDAYVFTLCRWTRNFKGPKARDLPHLGPYLQRMAQRPAVQRVFAAEQLSAPLF
ncbi:glutathione S-transferase family protein [Ramlibacter ginsenosidimutans]|uniref:Glutathione S-transferase family protein n=1 Tax=Ramlibacter ginsenosidimutans TaxID=502333 RepID=A0A934WLW1_9BURK|nr:glutathione S-transferase family protein [Ramlibacter ginsenosidimutans]MBK6006005.1 glutathione S-transferase family protein [Ramlibacter ginsenosidimutans]